MKFLRRDKLQQKGKMKESDSEEEKKGDSSESSDEEEEFVGSDTDWEAFGTSAADEFKGEVEILMRIHGAEVERMEGKNGKFEPFIKLVEVITRRDCKIIVTEYIVGFTLSALRDNERLVLENRAREMETISDLEVRNILWPFAKAMEKMHDIGVLHRDLHQKNVMLCFDEV